VIGGKVILLTALTVVTGPHDAFDPLIDPNVVRAASEFLGGACGLRHTKRVEK
jgi:hypothetical protein